MLAAKRSTCGTTNQSQRDAAAKVRAIQKIAANHSDILVTPCQPVRTANRLFSAQFSYEAQPKLQLLQKLTPRALPFRIDCLIVTNACAEARSRTYHFATRKQSTPERRSFVQSESESFSDRNGPSRTR